MFDGGCPLVRAGAAAGTRYDTQAKAAKQDSAVSPPTGAPHLHVAAAVMGEMVGGGNDMEDEAMTIIHAVYNAAMGDFDVLQRRVSSFRVKEAYQKGAAGAVRYKLTYSVVPLPDLKILDMEGPQLSHKFSAALRFRFLKAGGEEKVGAPPHSGLERISEANLGRLAAPQLNTCERARARALAGWRRRPWRATRA